MEMQICPPKAADFGYEQRPTMAQIRARSFIKRGVRARVEKNKRGESHFDSNPLQPGGREQERAPRIRAQMNIAKALNRNFLNYRVGRYTHTHILYINSHFILLSRCGVCHSQPLSLFAIAASQHLALIVLLLICCCCKYTRAIIISRQQQRRQKH